MTPFHIQYSGDKVGLELISDSEHREDNTYLTIGSQMHYVFCEYLEEDCIILVLNCINSVFWWADKSILPQSPLSLQSLQWWQYWKLPIRPGSTNTNILIYHKLFLNSQMMRLMFDKQEYHHMKQALLHGNYDTVPSCRNMIKLMGWWKIHNSIANTLELCLFCINLSKWSKRMPYFIQHGRV